MGLSEKDRAILNYLQDIKLELHEDGHGYTLVFCFEKNSYFKELELKKQFKMSQPNVIEACIGTEINWMPGQDVTHEKKKKGKGKNKKTVVVKCDSFFNFFESIDVNELSSAMMEAKDKDQDEDEEGDEKAEQMDQDFELGNSIKDDLIPLALEYYLGVIEQPEDEDEDDDDEEGGSDSDEPSSKKCKSKKSCCTDSEKECGASDAPGEDQKECKQQ